MVLFFGLSPGRLPFKDVTNCDRRRCRTPVVNTNCSFSLRQISLIFNRARAGSGYPDARSRTTVRRAESRFPLRTREVSSRQSSGGGSSGTRSRETLRVWAGPGQVKIRVALAFASLPGAQKRRWGLCPCRVYTMNRRPCRGG